MSSEVVQIEYELCNGDFLLVSWFASGTFIASYWILNMLRILCELVVQVVLLHPFIQVVVVIVWYDFSFYWPYVIGVSSWSDVHNLGNGAVRICSR